MFDTSHAGSREIDGKKSLVRQRKVDSRQSEALAEPKRVHRQQEILPCIEMSGDRKVSASELSLLVACCGS